MNSKYIDMAERAGWTGVQAALGVAITEPGHHPAVVGCAHGALVLSAAKTWVVKKAA
jgi:hypothetical protein